MVVVEKIRLKRRKEEAILPSMAHEGDACYDLYSVDDVYIGPGKTKAVDTGFDVANTVSQVDLAS